jgi:hypothetical protein
MPEKKTGIRTMDLKKAGGKLCHGCPDAAPGCKEQCMVFLEATTPSGKIREYSFQSGLVNVKDR